MRLLQRGTHSAVAADPPIQEQPLPRRAPPMLGSLSGIGTPRGVQGHQRRCYNPSGRTRALKEGTGPSAAAATRSSLKCLVVRALRCRKTITKHQHIANQCAKDGCRQGGNRPIAGQLPSPGRAPNPRAGARRRARAGPGCGLSGSLQSPPKRSLHLPFRRSAHQPAHSENSMSPSEFRSMA